MLRRPSYWLPFPVLGVVVVVWFRLGVLAACLCSGCVVQPGPAKPQPAPTLAAVLPAASPRIGLEFLPPVLDHDQPRAEPATRPTAPQAPNTPGGRRTTAAAPSLQPWQLQQLPTTFGASLAEAEQVFRAAHTIDFDAIANPVERETLRFVQDLIREDWRRSGRAGREPFFAWQPPDTGEPLLWSEELAARNREEWLQSHGPAHLRKPLQQLLRRLPVVADLELELTQFRAEHLPLTQDYQDLHRGSGQACRWSVRLRPSQLQDPLEMVFQFGPVRLGSSQKFGKVAVVQPLGDRLQAEVHWRTDYDRGSHWWRAELTYRWSRFTSLHCGYGDGLRMLPNTADAALLAAVPDGPPLLVVYAVHTF
jgi:hypothetical protein